MMRTKKQLDGASSCFLSLFRREESFRWPSAEEGARKEDAR
ncbi:hypothetical protein GBL_0025 [Geobacillus kaustophilus GBlys]|uniref:Uncharacterized protein n=1 Tax=Geobacillus kaustophilus GBlys TaxID=1337888 RepID=U2Y5B7_GEOKU|nr:hypothetical protein GBL_0025 [Geobacillus kaustophilus GBlys]